jgi:PAS domain S-box-containing protein
LVVASHLRVRFRRGENVDAVTLYEAVLAPLIFTFPTATVAVTVIAAQIIAALLRRAPFVKATFNIAQWSLAASLGSLALNSMRGDEGVSLESLGQVIVALACVSLVNNTAFTVVLAISGGDPVSAVLRDLRPVLVPGWLVGWGVNTLIGLLFVMAYDATPLAVVLFPVPLAILHLAYRGYAAARSDRHRLDGLRKSAHTLSTPLHPRDAIDDFLVDVTKCFEAGGAGLVLATETGDFEYHQFDGTGSVPMRHEPGNGVSMATVLAEQDQPGIFTTGDTHILADLLGGMGWRDCMCAPLIDERRRLGTLAVFDRTGIEGDTVADLAVLEALARETAHTIARGRLFESVIEERRKLDQIVGTTSDGIFTLADDGTPITWNAGCEKITGLSAREVIGHREVLTRLDARTAAGVPIDFAGWATQPTLPAEVLVTRADGSHRRLSCSVSTATDVELKTRTLVVVARDITPAEEYEELREQFGRLVEAQAAQRLVVEHLQRAVAPEPPGIEGGDIAVAYVASDAASPTGGDLFDWHLLPGGELHIAVVDLLGHGVEATRHALLVVHALRFAAVDGTPLEQMVVRADQLLSAQGSDVVATVVIARYRPETGELKVVSGGHPPALVIAADGEVTQLAAWGGAIGWPGVGSDNVVTTTLKPNESLVLYTDGLIEARKNVIDGMDTLMRHASDVAHLPAAELADELVKRSLKGAYRRDDSLALVLRRTRTSVSRRRMSWDVEPGNQAAIREARQGLESWLSSHRSAHEDAVLVAAELLANAVVAARSSVVLTASLEGERVVVEVSDDGRGDAHLDEQGDHLPVTESEHGRGLFLVRALSDDVSMMSTDEGTVVTCVLATNAGSSESTRARSVRKG